MKVSFNRSYFDIVFGLRFGLERYLVIFFIGFSAFCLINPIINQSSLVLDGVFIALCTAALVVKGSRINAMVFCLLLVLFLYILVKFIYFTVLSDLNIHEVSVGDLKNFLYSNKFLFYLFLTGVMAGKNIFRRDFFTLTSYFLLIVMVATYAVKKIAFDIDRPTLFIENNFEMMLVSLMVMADTIFRRRAFEPADYKILILLVICLALSGSRSAALTCLPVILMAHSKVSAKNMILGSIGILASLYFIVDTFASRSSSINEIDRFKFLIILLREMESFSLLNYLIGHVELTPLSASSCFELSYYERLFSSTGDGQCYALILHSFFMRVLFDHGILTILFVYIFLFTAFRKSNYSTYETLLILTIPTASALSISSFASSFVAMPLAMLCAWVPPSKPESNI